MLGSTRRLTISIAALVLLGSSLALPAADALSPSAAVPATESGVRATLVAGGKEFTCAVLVGGHAKCWGENDSGQLGIGSTSGDLGAVGNQPGEMGDYLTTVDLGAGRTVRSIAAGNAHTCAILDNGRVKCWGGNGAGQLGLGDTNARGDASNEMGDRLPYVRLGSGRKAKSIALGAFHSCAVLDNGAVKCWGGNNSGQLGRGNTAPVGDGADEMGDNLAAIDLGGQKAKAVTAGYFFTCALLTNGSVKCWGSNEEGELGTGDNTGSKLKIGDTAGEMGSALVTADLGGLKAKSITSGWYHVCALLTNGSVKCWGWNNNGQLGLGNTITRGDSTAPDHAMGSLLPAVALGTGRRATTLVAGRWHTCAILNNGDLKCWGNNGWGELGYGNTINRGNNASLEASAMGDSLPRVDLGVGRKAKAISGGGWHTCAVLDNGTLKCWGRNDQGELGQGGTAYLSDDPAEQGDSVPAVNLGVRVRMIGVFGAHACAVLENRKLECWGDNSDGPLGYGDTLSRGGTPGSMGNNLDTVDLGAGRTVSALAGGGGGGHTCVILDNGTVKCWGPNDKGQLGLGTTTDRGDSGAPEHEMGNALPAVDLGTGRIARAIAEGTWHTCAILDNGTVKCWGDNSYGQLGLGNTTPRGDSTAPDHAMGNALPAVSLGTGRKAKAISAGLGHTCAILDNGTVKCWGGNTYGQLGLGNTISRGDSTAPDHAMGNALPAVSLGTRRKAKAIAVGWLHTCALLDNGTVKCWGNNTFGQLGYGDLEYRGDEADEMGNDLAAVSLGTGRKATAIAAGLLHTCALLDNGTVKCWGFNGAGQLGLGNTEPRGDEADEMGDFLPAASLGGGRRVVALSVGFAHTCVVLDDRSLRCWGSNSAGELGIGDTDDRGDGPGEMGLNLRPVVLTG